MIFAIKTERKYSNYSLNNSTKPQEVVSNDHHPITMTSEISEISPSLKNSCAKGPSFVSTSINLWFIILNLTLILLLTEWKLYICFSFFRYTISDIRSYSTLSSQKISTWRVPRINSSLEAFLLSVKKELFINIKLN